MNQQSVSLGGTQNRIRFLLNRLGERLWVKPLLSCFVSVFAVFLAGLADDLAILDGRLPQISFESLKSLLSIMAASMLVIATFAVGAMLSAYASASDAATPRTLSLVIADDVSQNALSTFIGAFIFSIVGLVAHLNTIYQTAGTFVLFAFTLSVFAMVILGFVRWVDRIARLGRLGETIGKVEDVSKNVLKTYARFPTLCARALEDEPSGSPIFSEKVGFVQQLDVKELQQIAEQHDARIYVCTLPGQFVSLVEPLAYFDCKQDCDAEDLNACITNAFRIGRSRTFDEDPRFGMVVLSEIASRALSPAVNDPGTAIDIIGTIVRMFSEWVTSQRDCEQKNCDAPASKDGELLYDRVFVQELALEDLFQDAFNAIARDGAGLREVAVCLQKAFISLRRLGHERIDQAAVSRARYALAHAEAALDQQEDIDAVRSLAEQAITMETVRS